MTRERATELKYFKWFRCNVNLGPAESDIIDDMNQRFMNKTGKNIPKGWNFSQDGETLLDQE